MGGLPYSWILLALGLQYVNGYGCGFKGSVMDYRKGYDECKAMLSKSYVCNHEAGLRGNCETCASIKVKGGCNAVNKLIKNVDWNNGCKYTCELGVGVQGKCGYKPPSLEKQAYDTCKTGEVCNHEYSLRGDCWSCTDVKGKGGCASAGAAKGADWIKMCAETCEKKPTTPTQGTCGFKVGMDPTKGYDDCASGMCNHQFTSRGNCWSCEYIKAKQGCDTAGFLLGKDWVKKCEGVCEKKPVQGTCGFKVGMDPTKGYDDCANGICNHQFTSRGNCWSCADIKAKSGCATAGAAMGPTWVAPCQAKCEPPVAQQGACGFKSSDMDFNKGYDTCQNAVCSHEYKHRGNCWSCAVVRSKGGCDTLGKMHNAAWGQECKRVCPGGSSGSRKSCSCMVNQVRRASANLSSCFMENMDTAIIKSGQDLNTWKHLIQSLDEEMNKNAARHVMTWMIGEVDKMMNSMSEGMQMVSREVGINMDHTVQLAMGAVSKQLGMKIRDAQAIMKSTYYTMQKLLKCPAVGNYIVADDKTTRKMFEEYGKLEFPDMMQLVGGSLMKNKIMAADGSLDAFMGEVGGLMNNFSEASVKSVVTKVVGAMKAMVDGMSGKLLQKNTVIVLKPFMESEWGKDLDDLMNDKEFVAIIRGVMGMLEKMGQGKFGSDRSDRSRRSAHDVTADSRGAPQKITLKSLGIPEPVLDILGEIIDRNGMKLIENLLNTKLSQLGMTIAKADWEKVGEYFGTEIKKSKIVGFMMQDPFKSEIQAFEAAADAIGKSAEFQDLYRYFIKLDWSSSKGLLPFSFDTMTKKSWTFVKSKAIENILDKEIDFAKKFMTQFTPEEVMLYFGMGMGAVEKVTGKNPLTDMKYFMSLVEEVMGLFNQIMPSMMRRRRRDTNESGKSAEDKKKMEMMKKESMGQDMIMSAMFDTKGCGCNKDDKDFTTPAWQTEMKSKMNNMTGDGKTGGDDKKGQKFPNWNGINKDGTIRPYWKSDLCAAYKEESATEVKKERVFWKNCEEAQKKGWKTKFTWDKVGENDGGFGGKARAFGRIKSTEHKNRCFSILNLDRARSRTSNIMMKKCKDNKEKDARQWFSVHGGNIMLNDGKAAKKNTKWMHYFCIPFMGEGQKLKTRACYDSLMGGHPGMEAKDYNEAA